MTDQEKRIKAAKSLDFLRCHPAINNGSLGDSLFDGAWFYMAQCCKNDMSDSSKTGVSVYRGQKGWRKYKAQFDEELEDGEKPEFQSIDVPYKEYYGEPWVFDHVEYWYETTFSVFKGNPFHKNEYMDYKKWGRYAGPRGGANSFEDMLIQCERKVRRQFGSYHNQSKKLFLPEELANHKDHWMFMHDDDNPIGISLPIRRNPKYADVNDGLLNLRWLKLFIETDYCKKNWDSNLKEFKADIEKMENVPKRRAKLLEGYKSDQIGG